MGEDLDEKSYTFDISAFESIFGSVDHVVVVDCVLELVVCHRNHYLDFSEDVQHFAML